MEEQQTVKRRWRPWLKRVAFLLALVLGIALGFFLFFYNLRPKMLAEMALPLAPIPIAVKDVRWDKQASLVLERVTVGDYFKAESVTLRWSWNRLLLANALDFVEVKEAQLWLSKLARAQSASGNGSVKSATSWKIGQLALAGGTVFIDNLDPTIPPIPLVLGKPQPITFKDLYIGKAMAQGQEMEVEQSAMINHLNIHSPYDALAPVLTFDAINIKFTWTELLQSRVRAIRFLGPTIYVGPDLFWFVEQFRKTKPAASRVKSGWSIGKVEIRGGRMAVNAFGQPGIALPFYFTCDADNADLDNLAELPLKVQIMIPRQDRFYPEYKLAFSGMRGVIEFALPLAERRKDNVVPTVFFDAVSWNELNITQAWCSLTADAAGIYGKCGGKSYGGYVEGNFLVKFEPEYPWHGEVYATNVEAGPVSDKLAGKHFHLDGKLRGKLLVDGRSKKINDSRAQLELVDAGKMEIYAIDTLLEKMPAGWSPLKKSMAQVVLEAFRTYPFDSGTLNLRYQPPESMGELLLQGPSGKRRFEVLWHQKPGGGPDSGEPHIQVSDS
jgi:hypothetical protein